MVYSNPDQIGIIACPGGETFAQKLIADLETISQKKFQAKVKCLSAKYRMPAEEVIRRMNLSLDLRQTNADPRNPSEHYHPASFKVPVRFTRFANGEFKTEILSTVRNIDMFIIQDVENHTPLCVSGSEPPQMLSVNDHIFCLLVTVDAALQAGAKRVTVVLPAYPYARQHKKKGREGLTAARIGQILEYLGVVRLITLDIHSVEIENSFNRLRVENLHASYQILKALARIIDLKDPNLVIIAPDTGSVQRNKFYSATLGRPLGMMYKERDYSRASENADRNNITSARLLGSVQGKTVFMADDMLGTGGTILKAMQELKEQGAEKVICAVSLPFFNGTAIDFFEDAHRKGFFHRLIGTNAVCHGEELHGREWYLEADVVGLFARSIFRVHYNQSISSLMDNRKIIQELLKGS
jgi:ribose-phosphate pyrophosphokinase